MNVLICICSKYPNPHLYRCIEELYIKQINIDKSRDYKIHVVDSDSSDCSYYEKIRESFPNVEIHTIKNKNYEYGAWKYILDKYPNFDTYFCIQDTIIINRYIDLNILNDKNVFTFHNFSGYHYHPEIKNDGIENLKGSGLNYEPIINDYFNIAMHSSFVVNNHTINDIFKYLTIPPINKYGSCFYERNFGLYFIHKCIHTHNLFNYMSKIHGLRE